MYIPKQFEETRREVLHALVKNFTQNAELFKSA